MTPTEQDKELGEALYALLKTDPRADTYVIPYRVMDIFVEFITADRKRVALEARLDELSAIYGWSQEERSPLIFYPEHRSSDFAQMAENGMGTNLTVRERIAELKAQQEGV